MRNTDSKLAQLVRPVVQAMGFELVGVEYFQRGAGGSVLRVYIDRDGGITVDDCSAVSHQLSGMLDVEDPLPGHYDLEVSSPGLDRPLLTVEHFERFHGCRARIKLAEKLAGKRNLVGVLAGMQEDNLLLEVEGETLEIPLAMVDSARLVPEF